MEPGLARQPLGEVGVPTLDELLDAGDVDGAVVQVVLDVRKVAGEEAAVRADRVAAQRDRPGSGTCSRMNSKVAAPASSTVVVEARIAASSPDFVCISTTMGSIAASVPSSA